MFCDLAGSVGLSERLDPEELREVVREYQEACGRVIERFEGHVAQYLGDGLLVYFGYPRAQENDAERAVASALGILEAMAELNRRLERRPGVSLAVRVGIHTGLTVVGEMGGGAHRERLALGQTPNVAARLQALAEPDEVLISGGTHRLVRGLFRCEPAGVRELRGVSEPVEVLRVVGERRLHDRFALVRDRGLTPLAGREEVLGRLEALWGGAREGRLQVVLLSGEAGIGKSRTLDALRGRLAEEPHVEKELHASPHYRYTALYPVTELLRAELGLDRRRRAADKLDRIEAMLAEAGLPGGAEAVPLWASLLGIPLEGRYPEPRLAPPALRRASLLAVVAWLVGLAKRRPVLLAAQDLHWADPSTLELLDLLVRFEGEAPILLVLTFRPQFEPPWAGSDRVHRLTLDRLATDHAAAMIRALAGGEALPPELVDHLVAKTDGVPLFVEELTQAVLESDLLRRTPAGWELAGPVPSLRIPSTLQSSLLARLDRLPTAKEVAQVGAVVGRAFHRGLLERISPVTGPPLGQELERLVGAGILLRLDGAGGEAYEFKHALLQDAAYDSLLRTARQHYHGRIGDVLEERYGAGDGPRPELLAHHFTRAARPDTAIPYWHDAGRKALERSANVEAASHVRAGLELVDGIAEPAERERRELELRTVLGSALMAVKGYAASEVVEVFGRARELAEAVGDERRRIDVLMGLVRLHGALAELERAEAYGEELLETAGRTGAEDYVLEAHRFLGAITFHRGALPTARGHLERALELFDPARHGDHAFLYNEDTAVFCLDNLAWTLFHLGLGEEAVAASDRGLARARELDHPFTLAHALSFRAVLDQFRRDPEAALPAADEVIDVSQRHGFPHRLAMGLSVRGWALAERGDGAPGIRLMEEGLARWRAAGAEILRPWLLVRLAEAELGQGCPGRAAELLDEAEALGARTGEGFHQAELRRVRSDLP
jgi:class 3 adenylate cyclase/predicted ATPase